MSEVPLASILCYGDSLTWGYDPQGGRHPFAMRWPSALADRLGAGHTVIAEGLNGRTTAYDDHLAATDRNGARLLPTILGTHQPLDLVILSLGTNDLKVGTGGGKAFEARLGMARLIEIVRSFPYSQGFAVPKILIVSPPHVVPTPDAFFDQLFAHSMQQSRLFGEHYAGLAAECGCAFFNAASVAAASPVDGIHLDADSTRRLGQALVPVVRQILAAA